MLLLLAALLLVACSCNGGLVASAAAGDFEPATFATFELLLATSSCLRFLGAALRGGALERGGTIIGALSGVALKGGALECGSTIIGGL